MEKIFYNNTLIAVLVKIKKSGNGIIPITDSSQPLQVLIHKRGQNEYTKAHIHTPKKRVTQNLQECLLVVKGKIKIDLYTPDKKFFKSIYLSSGQAVILMNGGHAVHILKASEIFEIKNGPYIEDKADI